MYVPLRDVTLDEEERAEIEDIIAQRTDLPAHNKSVLRAMMIRDAKYWKWEQQNYIEQGEGFSQRGERN